MSRPAFLLYMCLAVLMPTGGFGIASAAQGSLTCGETGSVSSNSEVPQACIGVRGNTLLQTDSLIGQFKHSGASADVPTDQDTGLDGAMLEETLGEDSPRKPMLDDTSERVLEKILQEEEGVNSEVLRHLKEAEVHGGAAAEAVVTGRDHDRIREAIEQISEDESPDQALEAGEVITSDILKKVDGLVQEPEENPLAIQGDMMAPDENSTLLLLESIRTHQRWAGTLWPKNQDIPYCFASSIAATSKQAFQHAVAHYEKHIPCIKFKEVSTSGQQCSPAGVYVKSDQPGCFASVGKWPAPQVTMCNLQANGCDSMGIAVHELGHVLGMVHEQSRTDAAAFVKILWDNIEPAKQNQYTINSAALDDEVNNVPYDIMSVMHYGDTSFGLPGKKTMVPVTETKKVMGNRMGLTHEDARQVAEMYGCLASLPTFKTCTNHFDGCTLGSCDCHQDPTKPNLFAKVTEGACSRCLEICPTYPSGGANANCGCTNGFQKGSFASGATTYYNCKDPCSDKFGNCAQYQSHCGTGMMFGSAPIEENCPKTCGTCPSVAPAKEATTATTTTTTTTTSTTTKSTTAAADANRRRRRRRRRRSAATDAIRRRRRG